MTDVYLIRHGDFGDVIDRTGIGSSPLSPRGVAQAQRLRDRLAATREIKADVLLSSPLTRARQTADIIAPALHLPIIIEDDVQEFRLGAMEGMTEAEIVARYGIVDFAQEPERPVLPDGESWGQFVARISRAFDRITTVYDGKTIVIVCHDGVITASFQYFLGLDLKFVKGLFRPASAQLYTNNTSITYWHKSLFHDLPTPQAPQWMLVRYNDDVHLYDLASPTRLPWQDITVNFSGGPGVRPVRVREK